MCARVSQLPLTLFSLLPSEALPLPLLSLTKALCTQPLPLAAVSEPRPYENHMGERGWKRRGWGGWGACPPASIFPLPLGGVHGSWHTLPQTPLTNWIWVVGLWDAEGRAQSRAGIQREIWLPELSPGDWSTHHRTAKGLCVLLHLP